MNSIGGCTCYGENKFRNNNYIQHAVLAEQNDLKEDISGTNMCCKFDSWCVCWNTEFLNCVCNKCSLMEFNSRENGGCKSYSANKTFLETLNNIKQTTVERKERKDMTLTSAQISKEKKLMANYILVERKRQKMYKTRFNELRKLRKK